MGAVTEQTATARPTPVTQLPPEALAAFAEQQRSAYRALQERSLTLDLTRGKPSAAQLDLSNDLLSLPQGFTDAGGADVRNYGGLQGITELREVFAELLGVDLQQIIAGGNSSLTMMHDTIVQLLLHGGVDSPLPWAQEEKVTFICPVPGYDRHFSLLQSYGIDMVTVPYKDDGPDADAVAELAAADASIKGMWIVPTYANPSGAITSQAVAARLASMQTAAPDFKIFWDNAYGLHHLTDDEAKSADILSLAAAAGHPHRPIMFASTSKITFAGAGVGFLAASTQNIAWYLRHLSFASIGPDKVNQLRHAQFFTSAQHVREHMAKHREVIAPKFAEVDRILTDRLGGVGVASWNKPRGGYFVSLDVMDGTASRVVELAKEAGIALTPAGASFPFGQDPDDRNIRLAPTMPALAELTEAMEGVTTCVLLAAAEKVLGRA